MKLLKGTFINLHNDNGKLHWTCSYNIETHFALAPPIW